jgi:hypothetical protein
VLHAVPDTVACDILHVANPVPPPGDETDPGVEWHVGPQAADPTGKWFAGMVTVVAPGKLMPLLWQDAHEAVNPVWFIFQTEKLPELKL